MRSLLAAPARLACTIIAIAGSAHALAANPTTPEPASAQRPVVLELFTSEGCSSCPPADALLRELAQSRTDVLPLAFHVTYWDYLGWHDPFALSVATDRQRRYAAELPGGTVYTPQLVVDGVRDAVGSDRAEVLSAIGHARQAARQVVALALRRSGENVVIDVGAGAGAGTVYLVAYDREHRTAVGRGENGGRTLVEANIVRGFTSAAQWNGTAVQLSLPRPPGDRLAAFVQAPDGGIVAAAFETGHPT